MKGVCVCVHTEVMNLWHLLQVVPNESYIKQSCNKRAGRGREDEGHILFSRCLGVLWLRKSEYDCWLRGRTLQEDVLCFWPISVCVYRHVHQSRCPFDVTGTSSFSFTVLLVIMEIVVIFSSNSYLPSSIYISLQKLMAHYRCCDWQEKSACCNFLPCLHHRESNFKQHDKHISAVPLQSIESQLNAWAKCAAWSHK